MTSRIFADWQLRRHYGKPHLMPGPLLRWWRKLPLGTVEACPHCDERFLLRHITLECGGRMTVWTRTVTLEPGQHRMRPGGEQLARRRGPAG